MRRSKIVYKRLDGIGHPLAESDHPKSITLARRSQSPPTAPVGARSDCHPACPVTHFWFFGFT